MTSLSGHMADVLAWCAGGPGSIQAGEFHGHSDDHCTGGPVPGNPGSIQAGEIHAHSDNRWTKSPVPGMLMNWVQFKPGKCMATEKGLST